MRYLPVIFKLVHYITQPLLHLIRYMTQQRICSNIDFILPYLSYSGEIRRIFEILSQECYTFFDLFYRMKQFILRELTRALLFSTFAVIFTSLGIMSVAYAASNGGTFGTLLNAILASGDWSNP